MPKYKIIYSSDKLTLRYIEQAIENLCITTKPN